MDRIELIMNRACWAVQIEYAVNLDLKRESDVVAHQVKPRVVQQMGNVVLRPCEVVVNTEHFVALGD